jgi:hypothetical protein
MARKNQAGEYLRIDKVDAASCNLHCVMYQNEDTRESEKEAALSPWIKTQHIIINAPTLNNFMGEVSTDDETIGNALKRIGYLALKETPHYTDEIDEDGLGGWSDV